MAEALNALFKAECIRNPVMRPGPYSAWFMGGYRASIR